MAGADFWTDETSVLFTSFWGWSPETWGTVGWTGKRGRSRRENLLKKLSDPFITVVYVTGNRKDVDPSLKRMIAGFYLTTHDRGDRNEFVAPRFYDLKPSKWRHSLRAARAFTYLPEYRIGVDKFDATIADRALAVASMGELIHDQRRIGRLRDTPWLEVPCFRRHGPAPVTDEEAPDGTGSVPAGPANEDGYIVSSAAAKLGRQLYVLRLEGNTSAYLGKPCEGCAIYKVGLSVSPDLRRQAFHKSMPSGVFRWKVDRASGRAWITSFYAAVAGEDEMKRYLERHATHLGGEFYLATEAVIDKAWELGHAAVQAFAKKG